MSLSRRMAIGATFVLAACAPVMAGGDDYDAMNDTEGKGPAYFGFVRDTRGLPVADANVTLSGKGAAQPLVIKSNKLGLYRSHLSKDVAPDDVELSCEKQGYKQTNVLRRSPPGSKEMNIEINCTLQRL
jgi:hypothetical protein